MVKISRAELYVEGIRDVFDNPDEFVLAAVVSSRGQSANYLIVRCSL
jgi:hypothetical protein